MMRMSVGMIDAANRLMCGVAYRLMYGAANHPICAGATGPMSAGVNGQKGAGVNGQRSDGQTRAVTEIVVAGPTPAPALVPITCCKMANAGLTSSTDPARPMAKPSTGDLR